MTASEAPTQKEQPAPTRVHSMPLPIPLPTPSLARVERMDFFPVTTPIEQTHVNPLLLHAPLAPASLNQIIDLSSTQPPAKPSVARSSMKSFKGALTPHLSALMQRRGLSTSDLPAFIADAKKKVDLSVYDASDSEHDHDSKVKKHKQKKPKPTPQRSHSTTSGFARQASAKAVGRQAPSFAISAPPPVTGIGFHPSVFQHVPDTPSDGGVDMELSPGTAPGLVSDHDDDFDDDEAQSANGSHHDEDVEIRDASDVEREERKRGEEERICRQAGAGMC
jgi:ADA HAT complex component 1